MFGLEVELFSANVVDKASMVLVKQVECYKVVSDYRLGCFDKGSTCQTSSR